MLRHRKPYSASFTPRAHAVLHALQRELGLRRSDILETLVREAGAQRLSKTAQAKIAADFAVADAARETT